MQEMLRVIFFGQLLKIVFNKVFIFTAIIFLLPCTAVFADHGHHHEEEEWEPISAGPLTTWTAPLCGKGKLVAQPFFFYNRTRGTFNNDGRYDSLPKGDKKYQYQQQLFMQYGLTEKLEIDAQTVYQQNFVKQGELKAHSRGIADSYLFLRYCAIEEEKRLPHLAGVFQLKFPTGKYQNSDPDRLGTDLMGATSGAGSYDQGLGVILTKKLKPFVLHSDLIYSYPQEVKVNGVKRKYANYLNFDLGFEYYLTKGFNLMLELNGFTQGDRKDDGARVTASDINYITISPGIGWSNHWVQMLLAYQRVLTGTSTDANDSAVFTLVYTF